MKICTHNDSGFTLIEAVVAIAFIGLAMVALLRLQTISILSAEHARHLSRASELAGARMAILLASGRLDTGTATGIERVGTTLYRWEAAVDDAQLPELGEAAKGVRRVTVRVTWDEGRRKARGVRIVSYAAPEEKQ